MPLLTLSHGEFCKICAVIVYGLLSHIIPIVVSVVLTILVFREVYKGTELVDYFRTQQPCRGKRNITRAMIAVNVAFILLSLPHTIAYIALTVKKLYAHHGSFLTFHAIQRLLVILRDMNYSVNIFIYAAYIPAFRKTLKGLLKCEFARSELHQHRNTLVTNNQTQETNI